MKKIQQILITLLLFCATFGFTSQSFAAQNTNDFSVAAKGAIAVDFKTGKVLYNQDGDTPMGIASITKIISLYLVEDAVKAEKLNWDDKVTISDYAANLSVTPDLSNVPLHKENEYSVKELFDSAVIQSANASVVALAEKIAGSEAKFVDQMRSQLEKWGIHDAKIYNASGLNNKYLGDNRYPGSSPDAENLLSARDVAIVASHLIKDYPDILKVSATTTQMFGANTQSPVEMVNWNWMLPGFINAKEGVDGLKTGTTELAGACFVGTIEKNGQRLITVVLNATDHKNNPSARFVETGKLMDYCYEHWQQKEVLKGGTKLPGQKEIAVTDGKQLKTSISLKDSVTLWVRDDLNENDLTITPKFDSKVKDNAVTAPVAKGDVVGQASVSLKGDELGYLEKAPTHTTDIIVDKAVEKANIFVIFGRHVENFIQSFF